MHSFLKEAPLPADWTEGIQIQPHFAPSIPPLHIVSVVWLIFFAAHQLWTTSSSLGIKENIIQSADPFFKLG